MQDFIVNNYILIVVVCLFVIFTLIGYMADQKSKKGTKKVDLQNNQANQEPKVEARPQNVQTPEATQNINNDIQENVENNIDEPIKTEPVEEAKEPTLDDLIKQNSINNNVVQTPTQENNVNDDVKQEEVKEETNEDIEETKDNVSNEWQPELEEENKDIITANTDVKEDSK